MQSITKKILVFIYGLNGEVAISMIVFGDKNRIGHNFFDIYCNVPKFGNLKIYIYRKSLICEPWCYKEKSTIGPPKLSFKSSITCQHHDSPSKDLR